jgi:hypothetical protein
MLADWNNSPQLEMLLNSDRLSWLLAINSLFLLLNAVYLAKKQQT